MDDNSNLTNRYKVDFERVAPKYRVATTSALAFLLLYTLFPVKHSARLNLSPQLPSLHVRSDRSTTTTLGFSSLVTCRAFPRRPLPPTVDLPSIRTQAAQSSLAYLIRPVWVLHVGAASCRHADGEKRDHGCNMQRVWPDPSMIRQYACSFERWVHYVIKCTRGEQITLLR